MQNKRYTPYAVKQRSRTEVDHEIRSVILIKNYYLTSTEHLSLGLIQYKASTILNDIPWKRQAPGFAKTDEQWLEGY